MAVPTPTAGTFGKVRPVEVLSDPRPFPTLLVGLGAMEAGGNTTEYAPAAQFR